LKIFASACARDRESAMSSGSPASQVRCGKSASTAGVERIIGESFILDQRAAFSIVG
jgi:hypothetical protein